MGERGCAVILAAYEQALAGRFCHGDRPTIADLCLVAHLTSAQMLCGDKPDAYPTAARIFATCMQLDAFAKTHPRKQPDAPAAA